MRLRTTRNFRDDRRSSVEGPRWLGRLASAAGLIVLAVALLASSAQAQQRYAPLRAAARPIARGAAGGANPYTFVGTTSQFPCQKDTSSIFCGTLNVFMSKDMKRVKRLLIGFEASCTSADHFFGTTWASLGIPATRSRHNKTAAFTRQESADQQLDGGLSAHAVTSLNGKVTYGRAGSGTFQITITITDQTGQTVDTCATGVLPYRVQALQRA